MNINNEKNVNIDNNQYYEMFFDFLKENDCFEKFECNWYNLERRSCRGFDREYNNLELYLIPADMFPTLTWDYYYCNIIYDAFKWIETPEGEEYWFNIHRIWNKYIEENIISDSKYLYKGKKF